MQWASAVPLARVRATVIGRDFHRILGFFVTSTSDFLLANEMKSFDLQMSSTTGYIYVKTTSNLVSDEVVRVVVLLGGADLPLGIKVDVFYGLHHLSDSSESQE